MQRSTLARGTFGPTIIYSTVTVLLLRKVIPHTRYCLRVKSPKQFVPQPVGAISNGLLCIGCLGYCASGTWVTVHRVPGLLCIGCPPYFFSGLFTSRDPTRVSSQEVIKSRGSSGVGSEGVIEISQDGSGRVGLGRVGSGRVGSGHEVFKSRGSGRLTLTQTDP